MGGADAWLAARLVYLETARAVGLRGGTDSPEVRRFIDEWPSFDVIELDQDLAQRAVALALAYGLRSLDAIHLAAALTPDSGDVTMATFDDRLWGAAKAHGLEVVPRVRPTSALR